MGDRLVTIDVGRNEGAAVAVRPGLKVRRVAPGRRPVTLWSAGSLPGLSVSGLQAVAYTVEVVISGKRCKVATSSDEVRQCTEQPLLTSVIRTRRLKFFGHIMQANPSVDHNRVLWACVSPLPTTAWAGADRWASVRGNHRAGAGRERTKRTAQISLKGDGIVVITYLQNCEIGPWLMNMPTQAYTLRWTKNRSTFSLCCLEH